MYPSEGKPVRLGITVGDVEEWHAPAPQPSVELVFPELYAKAVSGTAISMSMNKVPMITILDFVTLSPIISTRCQGSGCSQLSLSTTNGHEDNMTIPTNCTSVRRYEYLRCERGHCNSRFDERLFNRIKISLSLANPHGSGANNSPR